MRLTKHLRASSGKCDFNIIQNGNEKSESKKSNILSIQNYFFCQRNSVYKGNKKDNMVLKEYQRYTLHNHLRDQRSKGGDM